MPAVIATPLRLVDLNSKLDRFSENVTNKLQNLSVEINNMKENKPGADPVVLLTDALNLALVGGSGGILPREILKSRTSEMRFPAF